MRKKVLSLLLATTMIATLLSGCGSATQDGEKAGTSTKTEEVAQNEDAATEETAEKAESTDTATQVVEGAKGVDGKNIGICIYKFDDNYMTLYRTELQRYLEAGGAMVTVMDGKNDQAEQTNQIENFISEGVDAMVINLVQASAAEQIADKCAAAGIPAVFINREPNKEEEQRWKDNGMAISYIGADSKQPGTFQGEILTALSDQGDINGDGVVGYVMEVGDPENIDARDRTEYSIKALEDAGIKVEKLDEQRGDWDQARGQEIAANALTAYGEKIDVIFCNNDAMALGALQAIEAAGRSVGKDIYLVGVDALVEVCEYVQTGRVTGTVFTDYISQSRKASDIAGEMIAGNSVEPAYMVDYVKVTADNATEILDIIQ